MHPSQMSRHISVSPHGSSVFCFVQSMLWHPWLYNEKRSAHGGRVQSIP
jgi:hypothetical protein